MKRFVLIFLVLALIIAFFACIGYRERIGDVFAERHPGEDLQFVYANSFSEGRAWVVTEEYGCHIPYLIDTNGRVYFTESIDPENPPERPWRSTGGTVFAKGVSVVRLSGERYAMINTSGRVVWDSTVEGQTAGKRIFGQESEVSAYMDIPRNGFNGYVAVRLHCKGNEKDYHGILGPNGTWLLEPGPGRTWLKVRPNYCYADWYENGKHYAIHLETREIISSEDSSDLDDILESWDRAYELEQQGGMVYNSKRKRFEDADGNVKIDLRDYDILSHHLYFTDGICPFLFKEKGLTYATAINKKGEQVIAPFRYADSIHDNTCVVGWDTMHNVGLVTEDLILFTNCSFLPNMANASSCMDAHFYDKNGNQLPWEHATMYPFFDGLALVWDLETISYSYIDTDGAKADFR